MKAQKIVIIGGTGLIGAKLGQILAKAGHEVLAASPTTGVNTVTGEGLAEALEGASIVVDVSNSMSFDPSVVRRFFEASSNNLTKASLAAGISHYVALSVVGTGRMPGNGYFEAKMVQEAIVSSADLPYTIVRSTQFLEFLGPIADAYTADGSVSLASGQFQPIAADDVATILADVVSEAPVNGIVEIGGPERAAFDRTVDRYLRARRDTRPVRRNDYVDYFGGKVEDFSLVPIGTHRIGHIDLDSWLASQATIN